MTLAPTAAPKAAAAPLVVSRSRGDRPVLVVSVLGRLEAPAVPVLRGRMAAILRDRGSAAVLVLDLTEVRGLSPSGLSATHQVCRRARAAGLRVMLVATGPVRRVIDLVRDRAPAVPYEVVDTRREAVAASGQARRGPRRPGYGPMPVTLAG